MRNYSTTISMTYDVLAKMAETNDCVVPLVITKFDWHPEERHKYPSSSTGNIWRSLKLSEVKKFVEKKLEEHGAGCIEALNDELYEYTKDKKITRNKAYAVIDKMYTTYQNEYVVDYVNWFTAKIFVGEKWIDVTPDSKVMADWVIEYGGDYEFEEDNEDDEDNEDNEDDDDEEDDDEEDDDEEDDENDDEDEEDDEEN